MGTGPRLRATRPRATTTIQVLFIHHPVMAVFTEVSESTAQDLLTQLKLGELVELKGIQGGIEKPIDQDYFDHIPDLGRILVTINPTTQHVGPLPGRIWVSGDNPTQLSLNTPYPIGPLPQSPFNVRLEKSRGTRWDLAVFHIKDAYTFILNPQRCSIPSDVNLLSVYSFVSNYVSG